MEDIVFKHKEFDKWCRRIYKHPEDDAQGYDCVTYKQLFDLSPVKFLYASEFDSVKAESVLKRLEDKDVEDAYKTMGRCFEFPAFGGQLPPQLQGADAATVQQVWERTCDPACATGPCDISAEHKAKAREISADISAIMSKFDGSGEAPVAEMVTLAQFLAAMKKFPSRAMMLDYHVDQNFNTTNAKSAWSRSIITFGGPIDGYNNVKTKRREQRNVLKAWIIKNVLDDLEAATKPSFTKDVKMIFFSTTLIFDVFIALLVQDGTLALFSIIVVGIYIGVATGSTFLAIVGMSEIVLSIPLAWFVLRAIGINYFGGLNMMTIFIVCAIGADDIFVFMDAYVQSQYKGAAINRDLATRLSWVYRKSGLAMLITSTTTCSAFLCCLSTPIPGTQGFGVFAALVIAADYVLVMTLFCTAVIIYHNRFEKSPLCGCKLPTPMGPCSCGCCTENCDCSTSTPTPTERALAASTNTMAELRRDPVEAFFREKFAPMILNPRNRIIISAVIVVWLIPAIIFVFRLEPTEKQEQFLRSDHPFQKAITALDTHFSVSSQDRGIDVMYTWGLKPVDRKGANILLNITYIGEPQFDDGFKFTPECLAKVPTS